MLSTLLHPTELIFYFVWDILLDAPVLLAFLSREEALDSSAPAHHHLLLPFSPSPVLCYHPIYVGPFYFSRAHTSSFFALPISHKAFSYRPQAEGGVGNVEDGLLPVVVETLPHLGGRVAFDHLR